MSANRSLHLRMVLDGRMAKVFQVTNKERNERERN